MTSRLPFDPARRALVGSAGGLAALMAAPGASASPQTDTAQDAEARAIVGRLIAEVQSGGDFALFEELFDPDFVDHTPFPGYSPDKAGARRIYHTFRDAFPDFRAEVHLQVVADGRVASFKTYRGTHKATFMGLAPTGRQIAFPIMDIVEVRDRKITAHWGVPHGLVLFQQLGVKSFDEIKTG